MLNLQHAEIGDDNRPGVGDSFKPQLSGTMSGALSNLESQGTQKEEKENRPPPAEGTCSVSCRSCLSGQQVCTFVLYPFL